MFCGLPIGVRQLPIFAATVCKITVSGLSSSLSARVKTVIAKGTKVISATSFVMMAEKKKQRSTKISRTALVFFAFFSRLFAQNSKSPADVKPDITAIRQKSKAKVLKSI